LKRSNVAELHWASTSAFAGDYMFFREDAEGEPLKRGLHAVGPSVPEGNAIESGQKLNARIKPKVCPVSFARDEFIKRRNG
jgi:hypothetical protein